MNPTRNIAQPPGVAPASLPGHNDFVNRFGPIDRQVSEEFPDQYTGDQPDTRHAFLWKKDEMIARYGGMPKDVERAGVVVIGGGMAGLAVTDLLSDKRPILLEQAARLGGTSKGEAWKGIEYAIGAAYFVKPEPGSPVHEYLDGLGILGKARYHSGGTAIELGGRIYADFYSGETDLVRAHEYRAIKEHLTQMAASREGLTVPEIPSRTPAEKERTDALDRESLYDYLVRFNRGELPPPVTTALERYCWSAFGGSMREISAASGLNFLAAEFGEIGVLPAGNATIAEAILKRILETVPEDRIRCDSLVIDVEVADDGVYVTYVDGTNRLHRVHAESVVMSCPKFVAARILRGIEPSRLRDIRESMRYRSYLVANVFLDQKNPHEDSFGVILLNDGKVDLEDVERESLNAQVTDVIMANFANPGRDQSVLTLYWPLPFDSGMAKALNLATLSKMVSEFNGKIVNEILPTLGFDTDKIAGLRITRWGHALPLAAQGLISSGLTTRIQEPFQGRVFFAEMGNDALPSIESALHAAFHYAAEARQSLS